MDRQKHDPAPNQEEPRLDRASWVVLTLALLIVVASIAQLSYRLSLPTEGWSFIRDANGAGRLMIFDRNLTGVPSPIQPNDELRSVSGQSLQDIRANALAFRPNLPANWEIGQSIAYVVSRDGRELTLNVHLQRLPATMIWREIVRAHLTNPGMLLQLVLAAIVFSRRPRHHAARLLLLLSVSIFASDGVSRAVIDTNVATPAELLHRGAYWPTFFFNTGIWPLVIAPLYMHLFLTFPVVKTPMRLYCRRTLAAIYGLMPALTVAAFVHSRGVSLAFFNTWAAFTVADFFLALLVVALSTLHTLLTVRDPARRAQIRWVAYGLLFTTLGAVMGMVGTLTGANETYPIIDLVGYRILFWAVTVTLAVSILRYRLFDIDTLINRTIVYGSLTAIVTGVYAVSTSVGQQMFAGFFGVETELGRILITLSVVSLCDTAKRRIQSFVDRHVKDTSSPRLRLQALSSQVRSIVDIVDIDGLTRRMLEDAVAAFAAEGGAVYLGHGPRQYTAHVTGEWRNNPALTIPLRGAYAEVGVLVLGPQCSGQDYTDDDRAALTQVTEPVARAIEFIGHIRQSQPLRFEAA